MTDRTDTRRSPAERALDTAGITRALRRGVHEALQRHKRDGNPIAVWRDGRVVWIPANEIAGPGAECDE